MIQEFGLDEEAETETHKTISYIDYAKKANDAEVIAGGNYDKSIGYFIEPTIIVTTNPTFKTMVKEVFGPVMTIYFLSMGFQKNKFKEHKVSKNLNTE